MMQSEPLIVLENIGVNLSGKTVIEHVDFSLSANEIVSLIGPNGAGKTTLVKIVLGLIKPTTGHLHKQNGLRIGYMPQKLHIEKTIPLTVKNFLSISKAARSIAIETVLEQVNISSLAGQPMQALSGGELQRVLLARALLRDPHLLVLDEPGQGVDINGQAELYQLITEIRNQYQCAVLMISHDLHLVMSATDRVICLNQHVCCSGHPEQVSNDPAYQELFGLEKVDALAVYAHHHDHLHDEHGNIIHQPDVTNVRRHDQQDHHHG
jgi:zinc transport system ATP-binding protein